MAFCSSGERPSSIRRNEVSVAEAHNRTSPLRPQLTTPRNYGYRSSTYPTGARANIMGSGNSFASAFSVCVMRAVVRYSILSMRCVRVSCFCFLLWTTRRRRSMIAFGYGRGISSLRFVASCSWLVSSHSSESVVDTEPLSQRPSPRSDSTTSRITVRRGVSDRSVMPRSHLSTSY